MDAVNVVYQQPVVICDGTNLPVFVAAFEAHAMQHQFIAQLKGAPAPEGGDKLVLYRRKMALL